MALKISGDWGEWKRCQGAPTEKPAVSTDDRAILFACIRAFGRLVDMATPLEQRGLSAPLVEEAASRSVAAPKVGAGVSIDEAIALWKARSSARYKPESVDRMYSTVRRVSDWAGWNTVADISFESADAILSARLRGDNECKWGGSTHDQAVSVLRGFGEFLRKSGKLATNPLLDLEATGEPAGEGARPLAPELARAFMAAAIDRHMRTRRARGCSPLFWVTMFYTGLRYSEAKSMTWKCITPDAVLVTDPRWRGNKSKRKDELPIREDLFGWLDRHRATIPSGSDDPVFPRVPTRYTWHVDRESAGIPLGDPRFGECTPHSARKSYGTWLDGQGIPRGLVSSLMRHSETLAEARYIRHNMPESRAAVEALPALGGDEIENIFVRRAKKLALPKKLDDYVSVKPSVSAMKFSPNHNPLRHPDPSSLHCDDGLTLERNAPGREAASGCEIPNQPLSQHDSAWNGQKSRRISAPNSDRTTLEMVMRTLAIYAESMLTEGGSEEPHVQQQQHNQKAG